ncbi:MAG TPA: FecR family protein [Myxococcaceae bacterium]|nr:FecR family protein [Myxococcaceae bacterium]
MRTALVLALLSAWPVLAAVGSVTIVEGAAFRTPKGGAEQPLKQGAEVELDDTLRTGADGNVKLTLTDQSVLVLGPESELVVERAEFESQERSRVSLKLLVGGVWAKVKKAIAGSDSTFEVSAARAVAGVRGTIFRVDATPLIVGTRPPKIRETVVRVTEGRVAVNAQVKRAAAKPPPKGPRVEVPGPTEVTAEEWEKRFVELQAGRQVRITDTQFQTGKATEKKDAIDKFLQKHP